MKNLKLSIAMATFNGEQYLSQQLESFIKQKRKPDEIVVCDDCSSDRTYNILQDFKKTCGFSFRIVKNEKKLGVGKNFEKAASLCTGDIIFFSDQDDYWNPNKVFITEKMFLSNSRIDYIISNANIVDSNLHPLGYTLWEQRKFTKKLQNEFEAGNEFNILLKRDIHLGMTTAIKRYLINIFAPIPSQINHDSWYVPLAAAISKKGALLKKSLVEYRQHKIQLFGGSKKNFKSKVDLITNNTNQIYYKKINIFENYISFLELINAKNELVFTELKNIISHYNHKIKISENPRYLRLPKIVKETINCNYLKYGSINNIIFDLLKKRIQ